MDKIYWDYSLKFKSYYVELYRVRSTNKPYFLVLSFFCHHYLSNTQFFLIRKKAQGGCLQNIAVVYNRG